MKFLERLQNLPEKKRKMILWTIVAILGISFLLFYIKNIDKKIKGFQKEEFIEGLKLPKFEEEMKSIRSPEIGESFKKLEALMRQSEQK
jgi:mannosyltransferase OCH1-like enzyme